MALTQEATGTTTTDGTEQTLTTDISARVFMLILDTTNMVNDDEIEIRFKAKVLTAGTAKLVYYAVYKHAQADAIKVSPPVPSLYSCTVTLKRLAGTDRAYDWELVSV